MQTVAFELYNITNPPRLQARKILQSPGKSITMAHFFRPLFPSFTGQTSHPNHCECSCHRSPFQFISAALVITLMGHSALPALVILACWTFVAGQITPAPLRHHCHSCCSSLQSVGSVVTICYNIYLSPLIPPISAHYLITVDSVSRLSSPRIPRPAIAKPLSLLSLNAPTSRPAPVCLPFMVNHYPTDMPGRMWPHGTHITISL